MGSAGGRPGPLPARIPRSCGPLPHGDPGAPSPSGPVISVGHSKVWEVREFSVGEEPQHPKSCSQIPLAPLQVPARPGTLAGRLYCRLALCGAPGPSELIGSSLIHAQSHTGRRGAGSCESRGAPQAQERGAWSSLQDRTPPAPDSHPPSGHLRQRWQHRAGQHPPPGAWSPEGSQCPHLSPAEGQHTGDLRAPPRAPPVLGPPGCPVPCCSMLHLPELRGLAADPRPWALGVQSAGRVGPSCRVSGN